jgi:hypothetical protein
MTLARVGCLARAGVIVPLCESAGIGRLFRRPDSRQQTRAYHIDQFQDLFFSMENTSSFGSASAPPPVHGTGPNHASVPPAGSSAGGAAPSTSLGFAPPVGPQAGSAVAAPSTSYRHQMISLISLGSDAQVEPSSSLLEELVKAGFAAEELKQAGFKVRSLVSAGFTIGQLKDAGFRPSELKDAEFTLDNFKDAGFTPEELRQAGFVISSMQAAGFNPKQLKRAGFDAAVFKNELRCSVAQLKAAGFTAKEIVEVEHPAGKHEPEIVSRHHTEVKDLISERIRSGHIFGDTWYEFFGFFAPFGTRNSFWSRLKSSPMLRHIFVFSPDFVDEIASKTLSQESPSPQITAGDVDSSVNNCALICALLIGIPTALVCNMGDSDLYTNMITSGSFYFVKNCTESNWGSYASPEDSAFWCVASFKHAYSWMAGFTIASFYTNIFSLLLAVMYYMCRPSESYRISSNVTLLEAFTLEVRKRIRAERYATPSGPESERLHKNLHTVPFDDPVVETEIFLKASYLAQNEAEEQKNQEFYLWYKSKTFSCVLGSLICGFSTTYWEFDHANRNPNTLFWTVFSLTFCIAGGRIFVIGIYLGLIASLVTTFFAINVYMSESAVFNHESPFFDVELVSWQRTQIFQNYTRSYIIICLIALFAMYICV